MCRESKIDFSCYNVYEDGTIWSKHWDRKIEGSLKKGYVSVKLKTTENTRESFSLNRVIYFYFNGNIPEGMQVNHIDEDKQNNSIFNLNLLSSKENNNWGTRNERISAQLIIHWKNNTHPLLGRKRPEHSAKMKGKNNPIYGTERAQETKNKISEANSKEVQQLSLNNELIKIWKNAVQAEQEGGFCQVCIRNCCRGEQEKHKGFKWRYTSK